MNPGFVPWAVMMLVWLGSISLGVIAAAAMVTYVRRTWQLIRAEDMAQVTSRYSTGLIVWRPVCKR